ncbi:hypothetical protein L1887_43538 [Cichorium endivia]|nr:hypothetical protein L1887_43538 [Cichorium endivia]
MSMRHSAVSILFSQPMAVSRYQTSGTTLVTGYGGQQGGNYSARTDDSVSPGIEQSTVHQGQAAGQRSSSGNITSSRPAWLLPVDAPTADERTGHIAESHQEFHHSGAVKGAKEACMVRRVKLLIAVSGINVGGEKVRGDAMQESYRENQAKLHEHSSQGFGPQNELQRRVAEQRSENEHKINESAGEIDKKQSTVQASSDILKGENLNATGNFKIQRKKPEIDQQTPVIDSARKKEVRRAIAGIEEKGRLGG